MMTRAARSLHMLNERRLAHALHARTTDDIYLSTKLHTVLPSIATMMVTTPSSSPSSSSSSLSSFHTRQRLWSQSSSCSMAALLLLVLLLSSTIIQGAAPPTTKATSRGIKILNESGSRVEIYWIHPNTREGTLMTTPHIMNGASFPLNSFVGHEFEARELPSVATGQCKGEDQQCRVSYFEVSENDSQIMTIGPGLEIEFVDDKIRAQQEAGELVQQCQNRAKARLAAATSSGGGAAAAVDAAEVQASMDDLVKCVESGVAEELARAAEEISFQASVRKGMAEYMENYTCADLNLSSSDSLRDEVWRGAKDYKPRAVHVMLDRPASKIHVVENFISPAECDAMAASAEPKLHHATVADGKGGSHFSEHRKAMQAGIKVPWNKEADGDDIARLSRRVYDYTNHVLGLDIQEHGQEDLMSIQYFGRGINDTSPDRYTPHCDGDCDGLPHKAGTRMATMVMYCTLPEVGGATNFRNAGVHVKPETGNAIFFSYIDPETKTMDLGFTEHSGCPVYEGEKKIVTQWIRYGVDNENPWDSFNTLGIKLDEAE